MITIETWSANQGSISIILDENDQEIEKVYQGDIIKISDPETSITVIDDNEQIAIKLKAVKAKFNCTDKDLTEVFFEWNRSLNKSWLKDNPDIDLLECLLKMNGDFSCITKVIMEYCKKY